MITMMPMLAVIHQSTSRNRSVLCGGGTRRSARFAHARRIDGFAFVIGDRPVQSLTKPSRAGRPAVASPSHAVHRSRRDRFFNQCLAKPASANELCPVLFFDRWRFVILRMRACIHACLHQANVIHTRAFPRPSFLSCLQSILQSITIYYTIYYYITLTLILRKAVNVRLLQA